MTFEKLKQIIKENNIPDDVQLLSDSGWECNPTEMEGIWYNEEENVIIFTTEPRNYPLMHHSDFVGFKPIN